MNQQADLIKRMFKLRAANLFAFVFKNFPQRKSAPSAKSAWEFFNTKILF